jgi:hypothetical protein
VATLNGAAKLFGFMASLWEKQLAAFPLMVSSLWALAKQDQPRQALLLGRADPTFCKSVQIRASGRQRNGFHAARRQHRPKRCAELRVAIMQNIAAWMKIDPTSPGWRCGRSAPSTLDPDV